MALESGIAQLVEEFIAAGRPSSREQNIDDRRAGYIASTTLAGETETRVQVEDIELNAMTFRVIAAQYRLAPEHTFPAAHNDAETGANTIWKYAQKLGIDRENITLAGDSAGGHLALVTALRLKAARQWQPAQLILIYPMLDATARFASYTCNGLDYIITRDTLLSGYEMYMPRTDPLHPEASPLWREDFAGLPSTHIITAEFDPLRDEGEALYQRFQEQDVECTCQRSRCHSWLFPARRREPGGTKRHARYGLACCKPSTGKMT